MLTIVFRGDKNGLNNLVDVLDENGNNILCEEINIRHDIDLRTELTLKIVDEFKIIDERV